MNLITGTLNAYHMASSQAEAVAAQFFGTIQIGRVRGEQLASVLPKVTAVSSELGVSLQEVNSMMVAMTIAGVKPAEAATALRGAMMALLKPSADLKKELHDLGFESGPQMIAAEGMEGTLLKLRSTTDENITNFARLIPNVSRVERGVDRDLGRWRPHCESHAGFARAPWTLSTRSTTSSSAAMPRKSVPR